jgi:hypothetical protein
MKKTYLSIIAAALFLSAGPNLAEAKGNFGSYSGLLYLNEQVASDYKHYQSIDWYSDGDQYNDRPDYGNRPNHGQQMSCNEARRLVRDSGYRNVDTKNCSGKIYMFTGRRDGRQLFIYVKARTGETWHN